MRFLLLPTLLLALACDRGPTPQGNAGSSESEAETAETETAAEAPSNPHAAADPHAGLGQGENRAPAPPATVAEENPSLAGVAWTVHEPLAWRRPSRPMRNGEYAVGSGDDEAVMTIFHFPGMGGSLEDNVQRWTRQFRQEDGSPAEATVNTRTVGGLEVTSIDTRGTFTSSMPMGGNAGPQTDQRMLGAIVAGPNGPVFFKLLGPADTVSSAAEAFNDMVESFHPAS